MKGLPDRLIRNTLGAIAAVAMLTMPLTLVAQAEDSEARQEPGDISPELTQQESPPVTVQAQSSAVDNSDTPQLQTAAAGGLYTDNPAGMCEVVNGFLGDFCSSNPEDAGCMALRNN